MNSEECRIIRKHSIDLKASYAHLSQHSVPISIEKETILIASTSFDPIYFL